MQIKSANINVIALCIFKLIFYNTTRSIIVLIIILMVFAEKRTFVFFLEIKQTNVPVSNNWNLYSIVFLITLCLGTTLNIHFFVNEPPLNNKVNIKLKQIYFNIFIKNSWRDSNSIVFLFFWCWRVLKNI